MPAPQPNDAAVFAALGTFLQSILPAGVAIVRAQDNRVPEPQSTDFVVMTQIRRERIETNTDTYADCVFTGSIAGAVLSVSGVEYGTVAIGNTVWGADVAENTVITGGSGSTFTVTPPQTIASEEMAAGTEILTQPGVYVIQLDVHSASDSGAADNAQAISTLFRDDYACSWFLANYPYAVPLHADNPRQMPFLNDQAQVETRWIVEAHLQVNVSITVPMQFADQLQVALDPVDVTIPA